MTDFVEAARLEQVPPGTGTCFTVADKDVAIFNLDGTIYAMENTRVHQGASLVRPDGKVVTCPAHGLRYDVTTGSTISPPGCGVTSYPAKIADGKILVAVAEGRSQDVCRSN